jgi:hypothetical protein
MHVTLRDVMVQVTSRIAVEQIIHKRNNLDGGSLHKIKKTPHYGTLRAVVPTSNWRRDDQLQDTGTWSHPFGR